MKVAVRRPSISKLPQTAAHVPLQGIVESLLVLEIVAALVDRQQCTEEVGDILLRALALSGKLGCVQFHPASLLRLPLEGLGVG